MVATCTDNFGAWAIGFYNFEFNSPVFTLGGAFDVLIEMPVVVQEASAQLFVGFFGVVLKTFSDGIFGCDKKTVPFPYARDV